MKVHPPYPLTSAQQMSRLQESWRMLLEAAENCNPVFNAAKNYDEVHDYVACVFMGVNYFSSFIPGSRSVEQSDRIKPPEKYTYRYPPMQVPNAVNDEDRSRFLWLMLAVQNVSEEIFDFLFRVDVGDGAGSDDFRNVVLRVKKARSTSFICPHVPEMLLRRCMPGADPLRYSRASNFVDSGAQCARIDFSVAPPLRYVPVTPYNIVQCLHECKPYPAMRKPILWHETLRMILDPSLVLDVQDRCIKLQGKDAATGGHVSQRYIGLRSSRLFTDEGRWLFLSNDIYKAISAMVAALRRKDMEQCVANIVFYHGNRYVTQQGERFMVKTPLGWPCVVDDKLKKPARRYEHVTQLDFAACLLSCAAVEESKAIPSLSRKPRDMLDAELLFDKEDKCLVLTGCDTKSREKIRERFIGARDGFFYTDICVWSVSSSAFILWLKNQTSRLDVTDAPYDRVYPVFFLGDNCVHNDGRVTPIGKDTSWWPPKPRKADEHVGQVFLTSGDLVRKLLAHSLAGGLPMPEYMSRVNVINPRLATMPNDPFLIVVCSLPGHNTEVCARLIGVEGDLIYTDTYVLRDVYCTFSQWLEDEIYALPKTDYKWVNVWNKCFWHLAVSGEYRNVFIGDEDTTGNADHALFFCNHKYVCADATVVNDSSKSAKWPTKKGM